MKPEAKVGLIFLATVALVIGFAFYIGAINPFSNTQELRLLYNYAGGIDEGSPVRVMGIKVGKVKKIEFDPTLKTEKGEEVKLQITISIERKAWTSVRTDSKFFINLAGVIGEKFLEITPGSSKNPEFEPGARIRGEDPPRIDQLISQSYGLAGKVIDIVDRNQGTVENLIQELDRLLVTFNKTLVLLEKTRQNPDFARLIDNAIKLSDDLTYLTSQLRGKKAEDTYELVHKLLFRLENLDATAIKKFLQEEGIKAKLF